MVFRGADTAADHIMAVALLKTISAHTNKNAYWHYLGDLGAFLFLADELEEFSRYEIVDGEWTNVKCRTECDCKQNSVRVKYTFDNEHLGPVEPFLKNKIERIRNRFELGQNGITEVAITCRDVRKARTIRFAYTKTLGKEILKLPSGKTISDIQSYLDRNAGVPPTS